MNKNFVKYRNYYLIFSSLLILASLIIIPVFGLKLGIDFTGGTLWQIRPTNNVQLDSNAIKNFFSDELGVKNLTVYPESDSNSFSIKLSHISEEEHGQYFSALKNKFGEIEEMQYQTIGPSIGQELKQKALWAIVLVLLGISLYVAFAFRKVSYPVKSWKYGVITLIALFHDVIIPIGFYVCLSKIIGIDVNINFVVAVLVIVGFSVHDTIVVFDRIRENLLLNRVKLDMPAIVNQSLNQTMARSINTSLTLIIVLLTMFFFGPAILKYFILTILVGTIVGTYSSIFIASSLLLLILPKEFRK